MLPFFSFVSFFLWGFPFSQIAHPYQLHTHTHLSLTHSLHTPFFSFFFFLSQQIQIFKSDRSAIVCVTWLGWWESALLGWFSFLLIFAEVVRWTHTHTEIQRTYDAYIRLRRGKEGTWFAFIWLLIFDWCWWLIYLLKKKKKKKY